MKKAILFCFISLLFYGFQSNDKIVTRTFACEQISDNGEKLTDYIVFTYIRDSISKGTYYGNLDDLHYVADITFKENTSNGKIHFVLENQKFTKDVVTPFAITKYVEKVDGFKSMSEGEYRGSVINGQLDLSRTYWFYDSRSDEMIFKVHLPDVTGKWRHCMSRCGGLYVRPNHCPEIHFFKVGTGVVDPENLPSCDFRWQILDDKFYFASPGGGNVISFSETNEFRCDMYEENKLTFLKLIDEASGDWYLLGKEEDSGR